jgi:phosphatidylglycerol:prolipoprotein diacylglycerol transferase
MFPIINIGPLAVQAGGFILILALFIGLWLTSLFAKNLGTNEEAIENAILIGLLSGLAGGRLGFVLQSPSVIMNNPLAIFSLTPTMIDLTFGVLVGVITIVIFAQKKHLPLWPTLDSLVPLVILLFGAVHLVNFAIGEEYGLPTDLPWGIELWNEIRHPVQIYALILTLMLLLGMLIHTRMLRRTGFIRSGLLISVGTCGLGLITLITRAFVAEKINLAGIDLWQLIGLGALILSLANIYKKQYRNRNHISVLISMGSNRNPIDNLSLGIEKIGKEFKIRNASSVYQTMDVRDGKSASIFLNMVIEIDVNIPFEELQTKLKSIEQEIGREPGNKNVVPLDLDILTYNNDVFSFNGKQIPDPNLIKYRYIAIPLAEVAPDFRHPAKGNAIDHIIASLTDKTEIQKIDEVKKWI